MSSCLTGHLPMIILEFLGACALLKLDPKQKINLHHTAKNAYLWDVPLA